MKKMKKIIYSISTIMCIANFAQAQILTTSNDSTNLPEIVVSGSKYPEQQTKIVQKIEVINAKQIAATNAPNTGDMLQQSGQVYVQKSQLGGSSPSIRGFEANRVLLVVDGVRMNNAIYRGGHLQNVITVDQSMLENIEILNGPASTLYGSDALGGVINFTTKKIKFGTNSTNAFARYSSACNEGTIHADVMLTEHNFGSLTSLTLSNFGNLRAGSRRADIWGNVGLRNFTATQYNGKDTITANPNPQNQLGSAYSQVDLLQKFAFKDGKYTTHFFNFQYSSSTDVPRYDRLTDMSNGQLKFAEWYYGPQKRGMLAYRMEAVNMPHYFTDATFNFNYQNISESRNSRRFGNDNLITNNEKINVVGFDANTRHKGETNEFIIGVDGQFNDVNSKGTSTNIRTNVSSIANSRFPDAGNSYTMLGAYVQDIYKVSPDRFTVNAGLRYNYINLNSRLSNNMPLQFPYSTIKQNNNGITGNVGLIFTPDEEFAITLGYSSGFKAPNLDDAARLFESGNGSLVVPNQNLAPEYAHNIDFGVRYNEDNKIVLSGNLFYTSLFNAIVMDRYTYNGDDSTLFYGTKMPIVALQNSASAKIYGFAGNAKINLTDELIASGSVTYTAGRYDAVGTKDNGLAVVPMDHIPPVFGRLGLQYLQPKYNLEVYSLFNGRKALSDYNPLPASEDNLQYAIAGYGTPGWITLNVKGTYAINPRWTLQGGVENIFDTHYRTFASGISAPGVNAILALRLKM